MIDLNWFESAWLVLGYYLAAWIGGAIIGCIIFFLWEGLLAGVKALGKAWRGDRA